MSEIVPQETYHEFDNPKKNEMIVAFVDNGGRIARAAKTVHISRATHYKWLREDPVYAEIFNEAKEYAADMLEGEAIRRAFEGVEEPVFYQGKRVDTVRKFSDLLLIFMLKGLRPHKFRDNYNPGMSLALQGGNVNITMQIPRPKGSPLLESKEDKAVDVDFEEK